MPIPASFIVKVNPEVLAPAGLGVQFAGMFLTQNTAVPIGAPTSFPNASAVSAYFGAASQEAADAAIYFEGFEGSNIKPGLLWFAQYPSAPVAAYLRGLPGIPASLAAVQAIIPGVTSAASTIAGTTLTVAAMSSGSLVPGMLLTGTGVTAGTRIVAQLTGTTGGAGTYSVSVSQTVAATTITGAYDLSVTIDGGVKTAASLNLAASTSLSDAASRIATALGLSGGQTCVYNSQFATFVITSGTTGATSTITLATGQGAAVLGLGSGATLSQGAAAVASQSAFMDALTGFTVNWVSFMTVGFEPNLAAKQAFATWAAAQNNRYLYVANDSDPTIVQTPSAFVGFANWLKSTSTGSVFPIYNSEATAAMACGVAASIDFNQPNGRTTFMFRTNSQVTSSPVSDATSYTNMVANGYSTYSSFALNQNGLMLANGQMSGPFAWVDSYLNAVWIALSIQAAEVALLQTQKSLPYNQQGYNLITAAAMDTINTAVSFGAIRGGVAPSASEAAQANAAAGLKIDGYLGNRGWYFQVLDPGAVARAARQTPIVNLWYMDGQSVQQLVIGATDVL